MEQGTSKPKLEELAKEIESVQLGKRENGEHVEYRTLLDHIRNNSYDRNLLAKELIDNKLSWFAGKLLTGYYDPKEI